jgi:hypothetical protein
MPEAREAFGREDIHANPYALPQALHADREGYPFATPQADLAIRLQSTGPLVAALVAEYGR